MKYERFLLFGIGLSLLVAMLLPFFSATSGSAHNQVIEFEQQIVALLLEKGVPVKSLSIVGDDPYQLEIILQSTSSSSEVAPEDTSHIHTIKREVALIQGGGLNLDAVALTILDAGTANVIYWGQLPLPEIDPMALAVIISEDIQNQLQSWIADRYFESGNVVIERLDLSADSHGQIMILELSTANLELANDNISKFMSDRWNMLNEINEHFEIEFAILKIGVSDESGQVLLNHTLDSQLQEETWWMDNNLTSEWFPSPLSADSP